MWPVNCLEVSIGLVDGFEGVNFDRPSWLSLVGGRANVIGYWFGNDYHVTRSTDMGVVLGFRIC